MAVIMNIECLQLQYKINKRQIKKLQTLLQWSSVYPANVHPPRSISWLLLIPISLTLNIQPYNRLTTLLHKQINLTALLDQRVHDSITPTINFMALLDQIHQYKSYVPILQWILRSWRTCLIGVILDEHRKFKLMDKIRMLRLKLCK